MSPGRVTSQGASQLDTLRSKKPSHPPRRTKRAAKLILAIELLGCSNRPPSIVASEDRGEQNPAGIRTVIARFEECIAKQRLGLSASHATNTA